ncbi:MAG: cation diffusion facilitator family transporter [Chloroflexota bacterium]
MFATRSGAIRLSLIIVIGLIALKAATAYITGSLSIIAQAADSSLDLLALAITALAVRIALKPADGEHPFGHGKVENIAAVIQAVLIFTTAGLIASSAIHRIVSGTTVTLTEAGIGVMLVSITLSIFLSRHLRWVSRQTDSLSLEGMSHNISADVYSSTAVLAGMLAIRITGIAVLDPIIALLVAVFILRVAYQVLRHSFGGLIDVKLPEAEEATIREIISEHYEQIADFHKLRTRKSGTQRYIDLHVVTPRQISVEQAHGLCDHLERDIAKKLADTSLTIHIEPCDGKCDWCRVTCEFRRSSG